MVIIMEKIFLIDNKEVACKIYKRSKKNIIFKFERNILHISIPKYFTQKELKKILENKKEWIFTNLNKSNVVHKDMFLGREFESADLMLEFYNKSYSRTFITLDKAIEDFFYTRVKFCIEKTPFSIEKLRLRKMKSAWGICYKNKSITLNVLLICCPIEIIDYVIFHELCHLKHMNHSKEFWSEVKAFHPNYKEAKLWLKANGNRIFNQNYL